MELVEHINLMQLSTWHVACSYSFNSTLCHNPSHEPALQSSSYNDDEENTHFVSRRRWRPPQRSHRPANRPCAAAPRLVRGTHSIPRPYRPPRRIPQTHRNPHPGAVQRSAAKRVDARSHAASAGPAAHHSYLPRSPGKNPSQDLARKTRRHAHLGNPPFQPRNFRKLGNYQPGSPLRHPDHRLGRLPPALLDRAGTSPTSPSPASP